MKRLIGVVVSCSLLLIFTFVFSGQELLSPLSTTYSQEFSLEKFYKTQTGMLYKDVRKILGKPFIAADNKMSCDSYSRPNSQLSDFLGWVSVKVCYNNEGKVNSTSRNVFFN